MPRFISMKHSIVPVLLNTRKCFLAGAFVELTNTCKFCWPIILHKIRITTAREVMSASPVTHVVFFARVLAGEGRERRKNLSQASPERVSVIIHYASDVELLHGFVPVA